MLYVHIYIYIYKLHTSCAHVLELPQSYSGNNSAGTLSS